MAITIEQQPNAYATVYNEMIVTASSTNSGQTDFSYIFEVCDSVGTQLRLLRIPPEIDYAYGISDVARVLESYVGTDFFKNNGTGDTRDCDNSFYSYEIEIGEEYDVSGTLTQFLDLASFTGICLNAGVIYNDFINWNYTDYDLDGSTKQFLTYDIAKTVTSDQEGYTHFLNTSTVSKFVVKTYQEDGTLIQTAEFANSATSTVGQFASAPASLNAVTLLTGAGSQPVITSSVAYYTIYADNTGQVSKTYTFNVKDDCGDGAVLHFLNDLGGFDSFPFVTYQESYDIKREKYKQRPKRIQSDGSYTFTTYDRENVQYHTKRMKKAKVKSDFLSDEESIWLRQLVDSPEVYLEYGGNFYSVLPTASNYEVKEYDYNDMFQLELDLEFSVDGYRQRY